MTGNTFMTGDSTIALRHNATIHRDQIIEELRHIETQLQNPALTTESLDSLKRIRGFYERSLDLAEQVIRNPSLAN